MIFASTALASDTIFNDTISSGDYYSYEGMVARNDAAVFDGSDVELVANLGYQITLKPDFIAEEGSEFIARIGDLGEDPCNYISDSRAPSSNTYSMYTHYDTGTSEQDLRRD